MTNEEIKKLEPKEQINYWLGQLCMSIGKGNTRDMLYIMIDFYQLMAYDRGVADCRRRIEAEK